MRWALTRLALQASRRIWFHPGEPRGSQIEAETSKNRFEKTTYFWHWFLKGSDLVLEGCSVCFFESKMHENWKHTILAKTVKIMIFLRENTHFQEIEDWKKEKHRAKIDEKSHVFWDIDFDRILGGFWEGFGRPKSSIFAHFSMFFRCRFSSALRKAKKSRKNAKKPNFSAFWRRVCGGPPPPGERKG